MPELPEVETVRRNLQTLVVGATIRDVELSQFTGCIAHPAPDEFVARLRGQTIAGTGRRGKNLFLLLDTGDAVAIHLRMTGDLTVVTPDEPRGKHHHLAFLLDDGRELRFSDTRKFGRLRLLTPPEFETFKTKVGPEPLDDELTPQRFCEMLQSRGRAIKPLIMDQAFLAGVGNIYADEALYAARIHPLRAARSLSFDEASRLLHAIRIAFLDALGRGGTTIRDYRNGLGERGENQEYLQIYSLNEGDPCPRCGTPINRIVAGQRGTRFCPQCQPAPDQA
ncbi:MAG: DNA-formamidopyrimidine glycosylase [Nitrolancea sp.]